MTDLQTALLGLGVLILAMWLWEYAGRPVGGGKRLAKVAKRK